MLVSHDLSGIISPGTPLYLDRQGKITLQKTNKKIGFSCNANDFYLTYVPSVKRKTRGLHFTSSPKRIEKFKDHIIKSRLYVPGWSILNWIKHREVLYIGLYWHENQYVGSCVIINNSEWANIGIFVKPEYRKKGIATALYKNALRWARKKGVVLTSDNHPMYDKLNRKFENLS